MVGIVALLATSTAAVSAESRASVAELRTQIRQQQTRTFDCQDKLGVERSTISDRPIVSRRYARWVLATWRARADSFCTLARELGHPVGAIRAVFGVYAEQALAVTRCESGRSRTPRAHNGQYLGMFQMGDYARSTYGHGDTPLEQAQAAFRYFVDSGKDWSPWSCKPW